MGREFSAERMAGARPVAEQKSTKCEILTMTAAVSRRHEDV